MHSSQRPVSGASHPTRRLSATKYAPVLNPKPPTSTHPPQTSKAPLPTIYQFPQTQSQKSQTQQIQNESNMSAGGTPLSASASPYLQAVNRHGHARKRSSIYAPSQTNTTARYAPTVNPQSQQQQQPNKPVSTPSVYPPVSGAVGLVGISALSGGPGTAPKVVSNASLMVSSPAGPAAVVPEQHIDNQVLLNCQFPIFHWESSNKVVFGIPTEANYYTGSVSSPLNTINVSDYSKVIKVEDYLKNFPGPLTSKSKKADVEKWIDTAIEALKPGDRTVGHIIWSLLKLKISGSKNLKAVSKLLYDSDELLPFLSQPLISTNTVPNAYKLDQNSQMRILVLLQTGNAEGALQLALEKKDFAMALLIGSLVGKDKWSTVVEEYLNQEFVGSANVWASLLSIIFQVFIGNSKVAVGELYSDAEASEWAVTNWRVIVAAVLINVGVGELEQKKNTLEIPPVVAEFLVEFGIFLNQKGEMLAAAILFMIVDIPLSNDPVISDSDVRFRYIGAPTNIESFFWAELYEYYFKLSNPKNDDFVVTFAQKLSHAYVLEELGLANQASKYADYLAAKCKSMPKNDPFAVNILCRLTSLNNRIGETNSGWLGKPKLSTVWGHLDKSFNKYIGGDDEVEAPKTVEAKIFDNLSASSSRNSSAIDITQQFTPYNANRGAALERGSQLYSTAQSRKTAHHSFYEIGNFFQPPRVNPSGHASPKRAEATAVSALDNKLHSPATATGVKPTVKRSVRQPPPGRDVRPATLSRTNTDTDFNILNDSSGRATSGISAPPKIGHRETYFKSSPDLSAGVESFQQPVYARPKKLTRQPSKYTPSNVAESIQSLQPVMSSIDNKLDIVPPVKSDKVVAPPMSPSMTSDDPIDTRMEVVASPMDSLPSVQMDVQPPHFNAMTTRDSISSAISEDLEITSTGRAATQSNNPRATAETDDNYNVTILEEKPENIETIIEDKTVDQDSNLQQVLYDKSGDVGQYVTHIDNQQLVNEDNLGGQLGFEKSAPVGPVGEKYTQGEVTSPRSVKQEEIGQKSTDQNPSIVPRVGSTKARRSSSKKTSYLPSVTSNSNRSAELNEKDMFAYTGYSPFSTLEDVQGDAVNFSAHRTPNDIGPLDEVSGTSSSVVPPPPIGQAHRISYGSVSEADSHEQSAPPRVIVPKPPITEKFAPIKEQEVIADGTLEPVIKKTSGTNFKTYSPRVVMADEREYNDVVEDESDEENGDTGAKKGDGKKQSVEDVDTDNDYSKSKSRESQSSGTDAASQQKSGWFGWLKKDTGEKKAIKAKLGHENTFYYDEKLKRWVNKNATEEEKKKMMESAAPPPPPIIKRKNVEPKTKPRLSVSLSTHPKSPPLAASVLPSNPLTGEKMPAPQPSSRASPVPSSPKSITPAGSDVSLAGKKANGLDDLLSISSTTSRRKKRPGRGYVNVMEKI